jgi:hypothetical protein
MIGGRQDYLQKQKILINHSIDSRHFGHPMYIHLYLYMYIVMEDLSMFFCYRSGSKSLDGARLEKPKFAVAPTCDRPLSQQGKIFLHSVENYPTDQ